MDILSQLKYTEIIFKIYSDTEKSFQMLPV